MSKWNHNICDDCWLVRCAKEGKVKIPVRISLDMRDVETCCYCHKDHMSGIWVRADPDEMDCDHE